ncbi:hypothetical protein YC2023_108028 [Brassica napus]
MDLTSWGANCWGQNRSRRNQCLKATDMYPNRPRTSSSMAIRPQTSQAQSIRGDQACTQLGCYVATEHASRSVAKRQYDTKPCILVYPSMLSPKDRSKPISSVELVGLSWTDSDKATGLVIRDQLVNVWTDWYTFLREEILRRMAETVYQAGYRSSSWTHNRLGRLSHKPLRRL